MKATLRRPWQLGSPKTSVCRLEAPDLCFIQLSLRSSSPAVQGQVKVLARLSTGLLWPGPGLSHYIIKRKVDCEAGESGNPLKSLFFLCGVPLGLWCGLCLHSGDNVCG